MNKSLTRSIGFWLLIVLSIASGAVGGWLVNSQLGTMTATLLDGTATGVEVYVGQSLAVLGSALVGVGVLGILIAFALLAVRSLLPVPAPEALEPIDWSADTAPSQAAEQEAALPEDAETEASLPETADTADTAESAETAETARGSESAEAELTGSPARS